MYYIFFTIIVVFSFGFFLYQRKKSKELRQIVDQHKYKISSLFGKRTVKYNKLTKEEKNILLSIEDSYWHDWDNFITKAELIKSKYPNALLEYFTINYPQKTAYDKKYFFSYIRELSFKNIQLLCSENEEFWARRTDILKQAEVIANNNPNGICAYKTTSEASVTPDVIVKDKTTIEYLQACHNEENLHAEWTERQLAFSDDIYYQACKKYRENDGRYVYEINYKHLAENGSLASASFRVWQGFTFSYSPYLIDQQTESLKKEISKIPEFKSHCRYFVDSVYNGIFELLNYLDEFSEYELIVVLVRNGNKGWTRDEYNNHYVTIINFLDKNEIAYCYLDDLYEMDELPECSVALIIDMITDNEQLFTNCEYIINVFKKCPPRIAYYSLIKEMSENEIKKIISNQKKTMNADKRKIIKYITECFDKVEKHSFFSYVAILNTFIGEAQGASIVKNLWLDKPSRYKVKIDVGNDLVIYYTIDDITETLTMPYTEQSMAEVVDATYELFNRMNLLSSFIEHGDKIVELMNERAWLKYH